MPAVGVLAPEAGVPDEDFLLDAAGHDEDESQRGPAREHAEDQPRAASHLGNADGYHECRGQAFALAAPNGVLHRAPPRGEELGREHEPERERAKVVRLHSPNLISALWGD